MSLTHTYVSVKVNSHFLSRYFRFPFRKIVHLERLQGKGRHRRNKSPKILNNWQERERGTETRRGTHDKSLLSPHIPSWDSVIRLLNVFLPWNLSPDLRLPIVRFSPTLRIDQTRDPYRRFFSNEVDPVDSLHQVLGESSGELDYPPPTASWVHFMTPVNVFSKRTLLQSHLYPHSTGIPSLMTKVSAQTWLPLRSRHFKKSSTTLRVHRTPIFLFFIVSSFTSKEKTLLFWKTLLQPPR